MKRLKLLSFFLVLFAAIGFVSCDTEPVDPNLLNPVDDPSPASFQVTFSGNTYQADATTAIVQNGQTIITGARSDGSQFVITVPATTPGVYNNATIIYRPNATAQSYYSNTSTAGLNGTVVLTSINASTHKLSGTFNFKGYWLDTAANLPTIDFTAGIFNNITFTGDGVTEPGDAFFRVKIDGVQFNAEEIYATRGNGLISVTGFRGTNDEYVSIIVYNLNEGLYGDDDTLLAHAPEGDEDNVYSTLTLGGGATNVTVNITDIDTVNHTISGTFSFTGYNQANASKTYTEGEFGNVPYTDENTTPTDDVFKATVDGTAMTYAGTDLVVTTADLGSGVTINLTGVDENHQIRLAISESLEPGNYAFSAEPTSPARAYFKDASGTEYTATSGTLAITSISNGWIVGTFSYTVVDTSGATHTITSGVFNVQYDW